MTVSTAYAPLTFAGNDATTAFSVTWPFFNSSLVVTLVDSTGVETVKTITTHYTVSGGTDSNGLPATGTVTMLTAPASGETLRIERNTSKVQSASWTNAGPYQAKTLEATLDKIILIAQEAQAGINDDITGDVMQLNTSGATDYWDAEDQIILNVGTSTTADAAVNYQQLSDAVLAAGSWLGTTGATDNALLRANGTGGATIQSTGLIVDDNDNVAGVKTLGLQDTDDSHVVKYAAGSNVTEDRTITVLTGDVDRTHDLTIDSMKYVFSRTNLKAVNTSLHTHVYLNEDGREGIFVWRSGNYAADVTADTQEAVFIASDGTATTSGAWVRDSDDDLNVLWFGAKDDCTGTGLGTDSATAFQAAIDMAISYRRSVYIPGGSYRIGSALTADLSANTGVTEPRITFEGDGRGSTIIYFDTGDFDGLTVNAGTSGSGGHLHLHISGLYLRKSDTLGTGLRIVDGAYFHLEDVHVSGWEYGFDFEDCLSFEIEACVVRFNDYGMKAAQNTGSKPNAITVVSTIFGNNNENGLTLNGVGTFSMFGGSIESNGGSGGDSTKGGLYCVNGPTQAAVGMLLAGVYIENNVGTADVLYASSAGAPTTIAFHGCSFARVSGSSYTTNNFNASGSDVMNISFHGCGFKSLSSYTPNASRPYVDVSSAANAVVSLDGSNYQDDQVETWYEDASLSFHAHSAVAASVSATTSEETLASVTIPGHSMGPNGYIEVIIDGTVNSNANTKRFRVKYGGTTFATHSLTTSTQGRFFCPIRNRNSASSQVGGSGGSTSFTSWGPTSAGIQTGSVDSTSDQTLLITGEKPTDSGDTVTLEAYSIKVWRFN